MSFFCLIIKCTVIIFCELLHDSSTAYDPCLLVVALFGSCSINISTVLTTAGDCDMKYFCAAVVNNFASDRTDHRCVVEGLQH